MHRIRETSLGLVALLLIALSACGNGNGKANAQTQPGLASATANWTATPVNVDMGSSGYCPSATYYQIPGQPDLFIGRLRSQEQCAGPTHYTLGMFRMDWSSMTMRFSNTLLDVPSTTPSGFIVNSASDPSAALYRGEVWVALVCGVNGIRQNSSCVAPLNLQTGQLDVSRLTVPMRGVMSDYTQEGHSAGVPKLLAYGGRLYIYSSVVDNFPRTAEGRINFHGVSARGAELTETADGLMVAAGAPGGYLGSIDPRTALVLDTRANDPTANSVADIFDVKQIGGRILVATSVGGSGSSPGEDRCVQPMSKSTGCYRLEIHQAAGPLGAGVFDRKVSGDEDFPYNPVNYAHFIVEPNGKNAIITLLFRPLPGDQTHQFTRPGVAILTSRMLQ